MQRHVCWDYGYSLIEVLVAMAVVLGTVASTLAIVTELHAGWGAETERVDNQQRVRVAVDALARDLIRAGAGASEGAMVGPLGMSFPAIFPYRLGAIGQDPPGTVKTDVLAVAYVPQTASQSTLGQPLAARSGTAAIRLEPGCPVGDTACGFSSGDDVLVYDDTGAFDTFRVISVLPGLLQLQHTMPDTAKTYEAGSRITVAVLHTYYVKTDAGTDTFQLMRFDGVGSDAAVVDQVVGLSVDYFADPAPPALIRPVTMAPGPWTTYGPKPPPAGVATTAYPPGENCVFQLDGAGGQQVSRLPTLGSGSLTLVKLTEAQLRDGPWCPDSSHPTRYDADLLRIRRMSIGLRIQAALSALRGPAGSLFARGGTSPNPRRWVPDQEIRFDVAPPNLNVGR